MTRFRPAWILLQALCIVVCLRAAPPIEPERRVQNPPAGAVKLLWHPPDHMTPADWYWGPGGREHAPVAPFRFLKEDFNGTSPKVKVKDARGETWSVKFGHEVHSDTFTPRLVYAAGYFAEPTYFIVEGTIEGAHNLKRSRPFIARNGKFRYARFKLHDASTLAYADDYSWSWQDNPFTGSHELNGLKILMLLTSNWDGKDVTDKDSNTSVFLRKGDHAYLYLFTDWGSTMGKWGGYFGRDKWDCAGYARQTKSFVKGEDDGHVVWGYSGKHKRDLTRGIRPDDVRWILPYLSRFTDEEIRAGLIASGASPEQVTTFSRAIRERIHELEQVASTNEASYRQP